MLSVLRFKNIGGSINGKFLNQKIKGKATGEKGCWSGTNNKLNLACNTWTYHWQKTWWLILNVTLKQKVDKRGKCKGKHEVFLFFVVVVFVDDVYVKKVSSKLLHCCTSIIHSFTVYFTLYFSVTGCQICWEIGNYVTNRAITIRKLRTSKRSCNFYSARTGFETSRYEEYVVFFAYGPKE